MSTRRERFRKALHPLYEPYYDALCEKLPEEWEPYFGYRSWEKQEELYKIGREHPGRVVTNARPGESAHNYGCASDWTIWKDEKPIWLKADDPRCKPYSDMCQKIGLRWGGNWGNFKDCYHNELIVDCSWKDIRIKWLQESPERAMQYLANNVVELDIPSEIEAKTPQ